MRSINPVQYNFAENWEKEILPLRKYRNIKKSFEAIREMYEDILLGSYEDSRDYDADKADLWYQQKLSEVRESYLNLNWLRRTFDGIDLKFLALDLALRLYPQKKWDIVGWDTEDAVVADTERTLVFDLKNFDKLSGSASLILCDDQIAGAPKSAFKEVLKFREERFCQEQEKMRQLKSLQRAAVRATLKTL